MSWGLRFDEPIVLPDGKKLSTLREAIAYLGKAVPASDHNMKEVQAAAHCLTEAAEYGGPVLLARMGVLQAIHRHRERVFNPDRKDTHWGRAKLKRER
jgi:hypothetical protein